MVPQVRIEREETLPGGRTAMILQGEGMLILKVAAAEITDCGANAMMRLIQGEIDSGRWKQNWPGDNPPGQSHDRP